jgi:acyl-CoA thioester hydrolase
LLPHEGVPVLLDRAIMITSAPQPFRFPVRVYYEDTDCMGVVYHASYLRFIERARTEIVGATGTTVMLWAERGVMFPVYSIQMTFRGAARLGDDLVVVSSAQRSSEFRITFQQRVELAADSKLLVQATVEVVCTDLRGELRELPPGVI